MNEVTTPRRSSALFYYLIANDYDRSLNAVVNAVGSQEIAAGDEYPLHVHPADYYFDMQKGRVLHEYQLLYVTQGKGTFRSAAGPSEGVTVEKGTMILLRPGELHSYCPDTSTGWTEYYIGFEGAAFDRLIDRLGLGKGQQVWPIGLHSELAQLYRRALEVAADNKTAPQPLLTGIVQHMIGLLNYLLRNRTGHATDLLEQSVEKAKIIMDERVSGEIDLYDLASELNLSYSWFRISSRSSRNTRDAPRRPTATTAGSDRRPPVTVGRTSGQTEGPRNPKNGERKHTKHTRQTGGYEQPACKRACTRRKKTETFRRTGRTSRRSPEETLRTAPESSGNTRKQAAAMPGRPQRWQNKVRTATVDMRTAIFRSKR